MLVRRQQAVSLAGRCLSGLTACFSLVSAGLCAWRNWIILVLAFGHDSCWNRLMLCGQRVSLIAVHPTSFSFLTDIFNSKGNGFVSGSLELACLRVCFLPWLAAAFPRLCLSAFTVSQPLLLQSVVTYVQNEEKTPGHRDGLIVAATLVYGGLAVSFLFLANLRQLCIIKLTVHVHTRFQKQATIMCRTELQQKSGAC